MDIYIFNFSDGRKAEYMLPNDVTVRELKQQFIEDGYIVDHYSPMFFVSKSDEEKSLVISPDNLDETVEMIGLKPNIDYLVSRRWAGCGEYRFLFGKGSVYGFYGDTTLDNVISVLKDLGLLCGLGGHTKSLSFVTKYEAPVMIENNQANMKKMISKFGLKKNCEYIVSCNSESYKLKKITIDIDVIKRLTYILPDCVLIEDMLRLIEYDASINFQDNDLYAFFSEKGGRIYIDEQTDATKTIAGMGFKSNREYAMKAYSNNTIKFQPNTYIFNFSGDKKEFFELPYDCIVGKLVKRFYQENLLFYGNSYRKPRGYFFTTDNGEEIYVPNDENMNKKSIEEIGLTPFVPYYARLDYGENNYFFTFSNGNKKEYKIPDALSIKELIIKFMGDGLVSAENVDEDGCCRFKSQDGDIYEVYSDVKNPYCQTLAEIGLRPQNVYEVSFDIRPVSCRVKKGKSGLLNLVFSFASGVRQEYIFPDNTTVRELLTQFVEDGLLSSIDAIGYSFRPQLGESIYIEKESIDKTVGEYAFKPMVTYFVEEDRKVI